MLFRGNGNEIRNINDSGFHSGNKFTISTHELSQQSQRLFHGFALIKLNNISCHGISLNGLQVK